MNDPRVGRRAGTAIPGARGTAVWFAVAAVTAAAVAILGAIWLAAGPGASPSERLGVELGCQCGTCPMRPIATCGCGFADRMLQELQTALDEDKSEDAIRAEFVSRYGTQVVIVPETSGFDLTAWALPILALLVGGVAVAAFLTNLVRSRPADEGAGPGDGDGPARPGRSAGPPDRVAAGDGDTDPGDDDRFRSIVESELDELDELDGISGE